MKYWLGKKRPQFSEKTKIKMRESHIGKIGYWKGKKHSPKTVEKFRKYRLGKKLSEKTKEKIRIAHQGKPNFAGRGEKSYRWKGGITPINNKIRNSIESKIWIYSVFVRDSFTCQKTKVKGGKLVAHHIQNFADFPELRFAIDNGITLSEEVHKEFHKKYGRKNNTRQQLEEFLSVK
jgi:hypothetical protein